MYQVVPLILLFVDTLVVSTTLRACLTTLERTLSTWLCSLSCLCHILRSCMPCCLEL